MIKQSKKITFFDAAIIFLLIVTGDLGVQLVGSVLIIVLGSFGIDAAIGNYIAMALLQICFALIVFLFLKLKRARLEVFPFSGEKRSALSLLIDVSVGILLAIVCLLTFYQPAALFDNALSRIGYSIGDDAFVTTGAATIFLIIFDTCILAPFIEETVFRGVLLSGLGNGFKKWSAVLLNGLAFSLFHMNPSQTVYQFFLGCACALVAYESRSLLPGIALHFTNNFFAVLMLVFPTLGEGFEKFMNLFLSYSGAFVLPISALGAVAVYFIVKLTTKGKKENKVKNTLGTENEEENTNKKENRVKNPLETGKKEENTFKTGFSDNNGEKTEKNRDMGELCQISEIASLKERKQKKLAGLIFGLIMVFCAAMWLMTLLVGIFFTV